MHYNMLNETVSGKMSITPAAGMMGTMFVGSDRYKVVCVKVLSPKRVVVAMHGDYPVTTVDGVDYYDGSVDALLAKITPNLSWFDGYNDMTDDEKNEALAWEMSRFERDHVYSLRKNHRWMRKGADAWGTASIHWGHADEYLDPCF